MEQMLTHSEWYVMDCLWQHSPSTVMELVTALNEKVGWAKSTTITTLRRMEDKGLVAAPSTTPPPWSGIRRCAGRPAPFWTGYTRAAWG